MVAARTDLLDIGPVVLVEVDKVRGEGDPFVRVRSALPEVVVAPGVDVAEARH